jgi:hypothetical protein
MLEATVPEWLRRRIDLEEAKGWVCEHIEADAEEKAQFPKESLLPWSNTLIYDDWEKDSFFVVLTLHEEAFELFFGTGYWPDLRNFAEGDSDGIPPADLHRKWSLRFNVPCPPLTLGRAPVKKWTGRDW